MGTSNSSGKAIKAGIGYTVGNYLLKGLVFFSMPIFARLMSTSDYGKYNTFAAYESILFVFVGLALHASFKNAKYKYKENFDRYISTCLTAGIISFLIWCIGANVFYDQIVAYVNFPRVAINMLLICSMASAIIQYYNVYLSIDYAYERFLKISAFNAVSSIALSVLMILCFFKENSYMGRIVGTTITLLLIAIYISCLIFKKSKPQLQRDYLKFALKFSLPIIPHGISQVILSQFDRIMIDSIIGSAQSGLYSFAYNIYTIVQVTASSLDNVWGPWFFEAANQKRHKEIKKVSSEYIAGMLIFTGAVLLVAPEIIKFLSPPEYWDSIYCVIPIVIAGYFCFLYTLPVQVEYYYSRTKFIALGTCSAALINIVLNYIFIPKYGYIAAAYTTLVTYFLYFIFHYVLARIFAGMNYFDVRVLIASVVSISVAGLLTVVFVNVALVRWLLMLLLVGVAVVYAQKRYALYDVLKKKLKGKVR